MPPESKTPPSQRRSAFRLRVAIRPRIAKSAHRSLRLGITNLSATGLQVRSQDELRRGDLLHLAFEMDGEVELEARVGRVTRLERVWDAGCAFEGVSERLSERIVQFIFAQQRLALRARSEGRITPPRPLGEVLSRGEGRITPPRPLGEVLSRGEGRITPPRPLGEGWGEGR
jgi:c-di-GMP-binding flagellar brake protein YcgR